MMAKSTEAETKQGVGTRNGMRRLRYRMRYDATSQEPIPSHDLL
jgi:hypothetical protein